MSGDPVGVLSVGALIFFARVTDVTLGTMRIVAVSRGQKVIAPLLGFAEVIAWLLALRAVLDNLSNPTYYVFFAGGFAAGTYVGLLLEEKLAMGTRIVRIVTKSNASALVTALRDAGHGVTVLDADGSEGPVNVLFSIVKRSQIGKMIKLVQQYNPRAFYSIEDVEFANAGTFAARQSFVGRRSNAFSRLAARRTNRP